ncbi:PASTA domain-containing protein [Nonomuraea sp. NPDC050556]|uniref:PASTA domain-containing protein n=1 Tax=Nonomuraea sp. NPDC050556 TaxID=3364369 RepID=UPI0037B284EF
MVLKIAQILVLVLVGGCGASAPGKPVTVPPMKGKQLTVAEADALRLGLTLIESGLFPGSFCLPDESCVIYAMQPPAGTQVQPGSRVTVKVLNAGQSVFYRKNKVMPDLVGKDSVWADAYLEPVIGLVKESVRENAALPPGTQRVLAQSPRAGAKLRMGQTIRLIIGYKDRVTTRPQVRLKAHTGDHRADSVSAP